MGPGQSLDKLPLVAEDNELIGIRISGFREEFREPFAGHDRARQRQDAMEESVHLYQIRSIRGVIQDQRELLMFLRDEGCHQKLVLHGQSIPLSVRMDCSAPQPAFSLHPQRR